MTMYKSCSKCGRIHPVGYRCHAGTTSRVKESQARKIRSTSRWTEKARQVKDDAHYMCEYCLAHGRITQERLQVHHIVPLEEDQTRAFDDGNLICLCLACHRNAEAGRISKSELIALANKRMSAYNAE